jgi:hypothetical protein
MILLLLENSIHRFEIEKNRKPLHVNEILDYVQKCYLFGEISIVEYKQLFCELDKLQAEKPQSFIVNTIPFEKINIPS